MLKSYIFKSLSDLQVFLIKVTNQNPKGLYLKKDLSGMGCMLHAPLSITGCSFILSELVAGVPRGAQSFGYVCTEPACYPFTSEMAIRLFGRLKAALYFLSL